MIYISSASGSALGQCHQAALAHYEALAANEPMIKLAKLREAAGDGGHGGLIIDYLAQVQKFTDDVIAFVADNVGSIEGGYCGSAAIIAVMLLRKLYGQYVPEDVCARLRGVCKDVFSNFTSWLETADGTSQWQKDCGVAVSLVYVAREINADPKAVKRMVAVAMVLLAGVIRSSADLEDGIKRTVMQTLFPQLGPLGLTQHKATVGEPHPSFPEVQSRMPCTYRQTSENYFQKCTTDGKKVRVSREEYMSHQRKRGKMKHGKAKARRRLTGGEIDWEDWLDTSNLRQIGKGGYGTVYVRDDDPSYVMKQSVRRETCRQWNVENHKLSVVKSFLSEVHGADELARIVFHDAYHVDQSHESCSAIMLRVRNGKDPEVDQPLHAKYQHESLDVLEKYGYDAGLQQLDKLGVVDIRYIKSLARLFARLHYVAQNNGWDTEVLAGTTYDDPKIRLYVIDFDMTEDLRQCEDMDKYAESCFHTLVTGYFPKPGSWGYTEFKDAYIRTAEQHDRGDLALDVINRVEEFHDKYPSSLF